MSVCDTIKVLSEAINTIIDDNGLNLIPGHMYYMGVMPYPDRIFVSKVKDKMVYYRKYPYYGKADIIGRIDSVIPMILAGMYRALKNTKTEYEATNDLLVLDEYNRISNLLNNKTPPIVHSLRSWEPLKVVVGCNDDMVSHEIISALSEYGSVDKTMEVVRGKQTGKELYIIRMFRKFLSNLKDDSRFEIRRVNQNKAVW